MPSYLILITKFSISLPQKSIVLEKKTCCQHSKQQSRVWETRAKRTKKNEKVSESQGKIKTAVKQWNFALLNHSCCFGHVGVDFLAPDFLLKNQLPPSYSKNYYGKRNYCQEHFGLHHYLGIHCLI